ncbi:MAG: FISUMP domain-containing protein [Bacteroidales bacterium]|jgi:uncharacterized protein (TIGR02145 family)
MKNLMFFLSIFCAVKANAQNYLISFAGTGASSSVATVEVENLNKETFLTLNGNDVLSLTIVTAVLPVETRQTSEIKIYPNPMTDNSTLVIYPHEAGDATVSVYDMTSKLIAQNHFYLDNSSQEFHLSGLNSGAYIISVKSDSYQYSQKLLCYGRAGGTIHIEKISNNKLADGKVSKGDSKGTLDYINMDYTIGERIKFTGISGNLSTVITDIPTQDETITFSFLPCTDGDNNNYPVVKIGNQVWMAENLKTTKFSNGDLIGTTTPATLDITGLIPANYQWAYDGDESNVAKYGRLYTWYAYTDSRNVCPIGWHIPTGDDWNILTTYLGGDDVAGGKLKETGTVDWTVPNGGTNETGFTALPGGFRLYSGDFHGVGDNGWWPGTEPISFYAWAENLWYSDNKSRWGNGDKQDGFSVRCLYGTTPSVATSVTSITSESAIVGGNITSEGDSPVTERGIYWSTDQNAGTTATKVEIGSGSGLFSISLAGLDPNTIYYVTSYAINSAGTSYGDEIPFKTLQ